MIPFVVIMTAANTVSRASVEVSFPPLTIRVTISATSMTVTATASTSEPNGSPTLCATTSAWWTAERTAAPRITATRTTRGGDRSRAQVSARVTTARIGVMAAFIEQPYWQDGEHG